MHVLAKTHLSPAAYKPAPKQYIEDSRRGWNYLGVVFLLWIRFDLLRDNGRQALNEAEPLPDHWKMKQNAKTPLCQTK